ncbi:MAG TPA: ATPase domain-containing protein [Verrucomicrobiae bacterium]|jgi:circadian clock protein KaiC|nr:ATPase domain-containing protein [Verrucomicrobiae bacterium]
MTESRVKTGIEGLDYVLRGGLPENHIYLLQGEPGVGKTTLAINFLMEGVRNGESVYYITLSETKKELEIIGKTHGWDLNSFSILELSVIEEQLKLEAQNTVFHPAEIELNQLSQILMAEIGKVRPTRIVFDSLSEVRHLAQSPLRYRRQMLALKHYFLQSNATVLMLDEPHGPSSDLQVDTLVHGIINLEMWAPAYGAVRRRLRINKLRGLRYSEGYHDYVIKTGGIQLYPRLVAVDSEKTYEHGQVESGIKAMDTLVGGGLDRGTSNLFMGPAGSGKSTLASQYVYEAARRGEKSLVYLFEETLQNFLARTSSIGMDFRKYIDKGIINLTHVDPAELTPGELSSQIWQASEKEGIRLLVVDSVNGYLNAMPDEKYLAVQLHESLTFLSQRGITSILVMAQHGVMESMSSPADITYLADAVIMLRYFEFQGQIKKAISVIKKRTGAHENTIREYLIGAEGLRLGEPLNEFQGVLTGCPTFVGSQKSMM